MEHVRRIVAVFLIATAIAVVVNLAATPLYHDGSADYTVWEILNYFMAVGTVIVLVVGILRKRAIGGTDVDTLTYLRTSIVFYGGIVLASLFFLGVVLAVESRQRDRRCGDIALDFTSRSWTCCMRS